MTTATASPQLELASLKRDWVEQSKPVVIAYAATHGVFTSDDLYPLLSEPENRNWRGVLLASLKNEGRIERVGYAISTRRERNGGLVRQWRLK